MQTIKQNRKLLRSIEVCSESEGVKNTLMKEFGFEVQSPNFSTLTTEELKRKKRLVLNGLNLKLWNKKPYDQTASGKVIKL
jgi:hypothetical protein